MSRWCLLCGSEYQAGALECADCRVPLSDRRPMSLDGLGGGDEDQIAYDFDELEPIGRLALDERFWAAGVAHAWDGDSLVVRGDDEDEADRLIDEADEEAFLSSGAEQVAYDLSDWDDLRLAALVDALTLAGIEHAWDARGDLVVLEHDEDNVDNLIDAIESGGAAEDTEDPEHRALEEAELQAEARLAAVEGLDPQDVLSDLFVAADRLMHDPLDHEGVLSMVDAARMAESLPLPYGFAPTAWKDIVTGSTSLRQALEGEADDDTIIEQATTLRTTLRQYV
ncbi:MAG: hypothetical protein ACT4PW_11325 [Acidimicrobiia bacterium]